jgi:hypothetical protein
MYGSKQIVGNQSPGYAREAVTLLSAAWIRKTSTVKPQHHSGYELRVLDVIGFVHSSRRGLRGIAAKASVAGTNRGHSCVNSRIRRILRDGICKIAAFRTVHRCRPRRCGNSDSGRRTHPFKIVLLG